jgi:transglutaminase-like putative cysteine protease/uncharacterized alpha-E superfamily protein
MSDPGGATGPWSGVDDGAMAHGGGGCSTSDIERGRRPALLARLADALYWAGRYLERAESMARLVAVHTETHVDLPVGAEAGWAPLLAVTGAEAGFDEHRRLLLSGRQLGDRTSAPTEEDVVRFVTVDLDNPSSVLSSLRSVRSNLQAARGLVPSSAVADMDELWRTTWTGAGGVEGRDHRSRWLSDVIAGCIMVSTSLIRGVVDEEGAGYLRVGVLVERADVAVRVLVARADVLVAAGADAPYADVHRRAVLRSLAAADAHRRAAAWDPGQASVLRFVLAGDQWPRSVRRCGADVGVIASPWPGGDAVAVAARRLAADADAAARGVVGDSRSATTTVMAVQQRVDELHAAVAATILGGGPGPGHPAPPQPSRRPALARLRDVPSPLSVRRLWVRHRTTYTYEAEAVTSSDDAHLVPRPTRHQRCLHTVLRVEPRAATSSLSTDPFGNTVWHVEVPGPFRQLVFTAISEVEVVAVRPPRRTPPWETARWLVQADQQPEVREAARFVRGSALAPAAPELAAYAAPSFPPGRPMLQAVLDLSDRIHRDFRYDPGYTTVTTPVLDVLADRRGVCQDFAHLGVGCLRAMGLAARYVSGYVETEGGAAGTDASHAWIAVFIPGWGWLDVDPTNDQLVSLSHVTVAWGRDYADVAPVRGTVVGGGRHDLEVSVAVRRAVDRPLGGGLGRVMGVDGSEVHQGAGVDGSEVDVADGVDGSEVHVMDGAVVAPPVHGRWARSR